MENSNKGGVKFKFFFWQMQIKKAPKKPTDQPEKGGSSCLASHDRQPVIQGFDL